MSDDLFNAFNDDPELDFEGPLTDAGAADFSALLADVASEAAADPAPPPAEDEGAGADNVAIPAPVMPQVPPELRRRRFPRWLGVLIALALVGIIGGGGFLLWGQVQRLRDTMAENRATLTVTPTAPAEIPHPLIDPPIPADPAPPTSPNPDPDPDPPAVTAEPVLATTLVSVTGPESYPAPWPYKAEYRVTLTRGEVAHITVACTECLWQAQPQAVSLTHAAPVLIFEALVLPGNTATFQVAVQGQPCVTWALEPGLETGQFSSSCVPIP